MEYFANPFVMILFVLTMIVISLSVISIRIQKSNKIQKRTFEQNQVKSNTEYASIGLFFQGDRKLAKCPSCAEFISIEAKICKHCGTNVESHTSQVNAKMMQLEKKQEEFEVKQKVEDLRQFKKLGLRLVIIFPVICGLLILSPIVKDQFFPTEIQKLAGEWKTIFAKCGVDDVTITIEDKSEYNFNERQMFAEGKFKATEERKRCLTVELNSAYEMFNKVGGRQRVFSNEGARMSASWSIRNGESGTWENEYAGPLETYTLNHEWEELGGYVTGS